MRIADIPYPKVREAAIKESLDYNQDYCLDELFVYDKTPQGYHFWVAIEERNYTRAREIDKEKGLGLFDEEPAQFQVGQKVIATVDGVCQTFQDEDRDHYKTGETFIVEDVYDDDDLGVRRESDKYFLHGLKSDFKPYTPEESDDDCDRDLTPEEQADLNELAAELIKEDLVAIQKENLHRNDGLIGPAEKAQRAIEADRNKPLQVHGDPLKSDWKGWQK